MEAYNRWFENFIQGRLKVIKEPMDRIGFLFNEKDKFISLNRGTDATQIVNRFDTLIAREKVLSELKPVNIKPEITENLKIDKEEFIDYCGSSIAVRIVILNEMGILEFLQNKMLKESVGFSANKLAEVISSFFDVSQKTLQSYLNPMISNGVNDRNNPLTENNKTKAQQKLSNIGFKIK